LGISIALILEPWLQKQLMIEDGFASGFILYVVNLISDLLDLWMNI
jgi:hypothetical protein